MEKPKTIITINYNEYTENVIITTENLKKVEEFIRDKNWSYFFCGETELFGPRYTENVRKYKSLEAKGGQTAHEALQIFRPA